MFCCVECKINVLLTLKPVIYCFRLEQHYQNGLFCSKFLHILVTSVNLSNRVLNFKHFSCVVWAFCFTGIYIGIHFLPILFKKLVFRLFVFRVLLPILFWIPCHLFRHVMSHLCNYCFYGYKCFVILWFCVHFM